MSRRFVVACTAAVLGVGLGLSGSAAGSAAGQVTSAEADLITHVPPSVAASCVGYTADIKKYIKSLTKKPKPIITKIAAAVQCSPDPSLGVDGVVHIQFTTDRSLDRAYALMLARVDLEPGTEAITEGTCPIESGFGDPPAGRVGCVPSDGTGRFAEVVWATWDLKILSDAILEEDIIGASVFAFFASENSGPI